MGSTSTSVQEFAGKSCVICPKRSNYGHKGVEELAAAFPAVKQVQKAFKLLEKEAKGIQKQRSQLRKDVLGWSQEKIGVAIGIDESSSRARISRYALGIHEPPVPITKLTAGTLGVPHVLRR